jgi:NTE family protein
MEVEMLAVVMSGAGNFGALQVGALETLLGSGLQPELVVGTSAGAINAVYFACDPTLEGVRNLGRAWRPVGAREVGIPALLASVRRLVTRKDSLIDSVALAEFLADRLPTGVETFGQLVEMNNVRAYAVAVCMETETLAVFGDHDKDRLLDGLMASAAIPPYFPPWKVGDRLYLDGGVYSKLPIRVAIERGARQVVAIDVRYAMGNRDQAHGMLGIGSYAVSLMVEHQAAKEIEEARAIGVSIYHLCLDAPSDVDFWDYSQAGRLVALGREVTQRALEEEPLKFEAGWRRWLGGHFPRFVNRLPR